MKSENEARASFEVIVANNYELSNIRIVRLDGEAEAKAKRQKNGKFTVIVK